MEFYSWLIYDNEPRTRTNLWYIVMGILGIVLIIYSIYTVNFIFAIMIFLIAFIVIIKDARPNKKIKFSITDKGFVIDNKLYSYSEFKSFYIIYEPPIKKLFLEFKNWRYDLAIQLYDNNPLEIRETLLKLLDENLERENEPMSEVLDDFFKF